MLEKVHHLGWTLRFHKTTLGVESMSVCLYLTLFLPPSLPSPRLTPEDEGVAPPLTHNWHHIITFS